VTWVAAVFALLVGATMTFVPYEFEARMFRGVYPSIRTLGLAFLAAGMALGFSVSWGWGRPGAVTGTHAPDRDGGRLAWPHLLARLFFVVAVALFWWQVSIRPGPLTGATAFPLLIIGVMLETLPRFAHGGLLRPFLALMGVAFAALMWLFPASFPSRIFGPVTEVLRPLGALALAMSFGLLWLRRRFAAERWLYLGFGGLFVYLAVCLGRRGSWAGMELYAVVAVASLLVAVAPRLPVTVNLRTKLLRGMVAASLLPLLAVGGLASFFAQAELERNLREDIARATEAEADLIGRELARAQGRLVELASRDTLLKAVHAHDADFLQWTLERLREDEPLIEHIFVQDRAGTRWAATGGHSLGRNFAHRDYHQRVIEREEVYVSAPYAAGPGGPLVVVGVPIKDAKVVRGVLGGTISLRLVNAGASLAAPGYRLRVVDRRDRRVLRDTGGGMLLETANLGRPVVSRVLGDRPGTLEMFDNDDRRLLVGHAPVSNSDWVVLTSQDVASAYRPLSRVSAVVGASVVLAALLAWFLARTLSSHFSRRIGTVTGAAQSLAEGDLGRRVQPGNDPDEVGTLARVFNQMADRLQRGQAQLEKMNDELRAALEARGELMEALRRADRRKDEFLAMLAHELRNPLAAVSGALEAMDRRSDKAVAADKLTEIGRRQLKHLAHMVDDLLDVSRITTNKITLRRERLDLRRVLESTLETVRPQAEARSQELALQWPAAPVMVDGDATRLEQVFANLLNNAVKYTSPGGKIGLHLEEITGSGGGRRARVTVSDNGRGISEHLLPNIFEVFVQGDITIDRSEGGLGLGLTLVRRLVEMHDGTVTADSAGRDRGSTFTVELPALAASRVDAAPPAEASLESAGTDAPDGSSSRRIVLVDDNQDAVLSLKDFLETCGHAVDIAHDGEEGRDLILHERPHVAFVDLGLPKLDGFEVARQVRRAGLGQDTRLVALTGYGDPETRKRAVDAGFDAHVVKPVEMDELERLIGKGGPQTPPLSRTLSPFGDSGTRSRKAAMASGGGTPPPDEDSDDGKPARRSIP
jgi:two-component system, OmpR family, sensor kinase